MSIGGTSLLFKEMVLDNVSKATKTRPFKAIIAEMGPEVKGCFLKKSSPGL